MIYSHIASALVFSKYRIIFLGDFPLSTEKLFDTSHIKSDDDHWPEATAKKTLKFEGL